jgi:hypothetical protein
MVELTKAKSPREAMRMATSYMTSKQNSEKPSTRLTTSETREQLRNRRRSLGFGTMAMTRQFICSNRNCFIRGDEYIPGSSQNGHPKGVTLVYSKFSEMVDELVKHSV